MFLTSSARFITSFTHRSRAYIRKMLRAAIMLNYKSAFAVIATTILCLFPLPFFMCLPTKAAAAAPTPEEAMGH